MWEGVSENTKKHGGGPIENMQEGLGEGGSEKTCVGVSEIFHYATLPKDLKWNSP